MMATVAVLIPCLNEEAAIGGVVDDFRRALPQATIHVFDNASVDATVERARAAGACVRHVERRGKGNVIARMFADVEADVYVLVDGDGTYDAASAAAMVAQLLDDGLDMVVGCRMATADAAYRRGHRFGNRLFSTSVARLFGVDCRDLLSGYRVFSRRFVKSFPATARGFEIETQLTVHALELRMPFAERDTPYGERPCGSASKLRTWHDGARILAEILRLYRLERPLMFFGAITAVLATVSVLLGIPVVLTWLETGLVPRQPTALLATGLMLLAAGSSGCGLVLDTVTHGRKEMKRLSYLACRPPGVPRPAEHD